MSKSLEKNLRDVLETVNFIKDNGVFKDDLKQFAIKEDLEQFATKEDLVQFATKKDLEQFATKKDLEQFATKKDLEQFAAKEDLDKFATKGDLFLLKEDLLGIIRELPTKEDFSNLLNSVDNYAKKVDTYFIETLSLKSQFNRLKVSLAK